MKRVCNPAHVFTPTVVDGPALLRAATCETRSGSWQVSSARWQGGITLERKSAGCTTELHMSIAMARALAAELTACADAADAARTKTGGAA